MGHYVIASEKIAQVIGSSTWEPWASLHWRIYQSDDGQFRAVNEGASLATAKSRRMDTLVKRLQKGAVSYSAFTAFKQK